MEFKGLKATWNAWGRRDPFYAILTFPDKRNNKWEIDEFFRTGVEEIDEVIWYLKSLDVPLRKHSALDFGCGAGRLTQALCNHFVSVTGVDVARSMIELANTYNKQPQRCRYMLNEQESLSEIADESFDFIYCCRVLQHMEPRYRDGYIREFLRVLSPAGILVFQQPEEALLQSAPDEALPQSAPDNSSRTWQAPHESPLKKTIKSWLPKPVHSFYWVLKRQWMQALASRQLTQEMHFTPRQEMRDFLTAIQAHIIDIVEDDSVPGARSYRYCVAKKSVRDLKA